MGMILSASYMLYLYRRVIFGRITKDDLRSILDLSPREWVVFAPLIVLTLWMGIYPSSFTNYFDAAVGAMVQHHTAALAATTKLASCPRSQSQCAMDAGEQQAAESKERVFQSRNSLTMVNSSLETPAGIVH
jgi:hypothetical protein